MTREPTYKQDLIHEHITGELICCTLAASVPFRILELERRGGPTESEWEETRAFAWVLGPQGDNLLYRSGKKGETARLMADLIYAIAVLAFAPGGVTTFGLHFDAGMPDSEGNVCCRSLGGLSL